MMDYSEELKDLPQHSGFCECCGASKKDLLSLGLVVNMFAMDGLSFAMSLKCLLANKRLMRALNVAYND